MKHTIAIAITCLLRVIASAQPQNYNKTWVLGSLYSYKTVFMPAGPVNQFWDTTYQDENFYLGHSNICDGNGNLLLTTDTRHIYGANHQIIDNGDTINSEGFYEWVVVNQGFQNSIFLPLGDSIYYLINGALSDSLAYEVGMDNVSFNFHDQLRYHVIDMKLNNYAGKVTKGNRIALDSVLTSTGVLTAVRHGNGKDWWVVRRGADLNSDSLAFYTFLVKKDTLMKPLVQTFQYPATGQGGGAFWGQGTFSNDGTMFANASNSLDDAFYIAQFDRCSGLYSNQVRRHIPHVSIPPNALNSEDSVVTGICFSPNDSLLYVATLKHVFQLDLYNPDSSTAWVHLSGPDTNIITSFNGYMNISIGHDDKLYIGCQGQIGNTMSVIDHPNVKGVGAGFCPRCMRYPTKVINGFTFGFVSQPPNMPNYTLGAINPPCPVDTVTGVGMVGVTGNGLKIYPNPASTSVTVETKISGSFVLADALGRVVMTASVSKGTQVLPVGQLPKGLYLYRFTAGNGELKAGKLLIAD